MKKINDIKKYFDEINENLLLNHKLLFSLKDLILKTKKNNGKIIIFGNGGSASTSNHVSVDLTKNANIQSINFNEANLITCFSNDYGYEKWITKAIEFYSNKRDLVIILSVSGESKNLVNAAKWCKKNKLNVVTFTGKSKNNSLIKINKKKLNFFVNSNSYNIVEIVHHALLLCVVDMIIGRKVYSV